jgi:glutamate N-acetyltransferase / amino-acid N-acetyltransferase
VSGAMKAAAEVVVEIELAAGTTSATAWGCDLSAEYVRVNADYTT